MERVQLGRTGRQVSRVGFGGATAGLKNYLQEFDPENERDRQRIIEAIQTALDLGINYFDTAPAYGKGQSEELFGEALQGTDAGELFLATKVSIKRESQGDVRRSLEASLKRLRRDYVDLLQLHGTTISDEAADRVLGKDGILEEMQQLKSEGLVRSIGFTSEDQNISVYRLIRSGDFDVMQICYNFLFQHPYEPNRPFGTLFEAEQQRMGITTMRAPTSGWFQKWIQTVNPDNTFDYTPALIQFVLSNPLVDVALIGMRSAERVRQNVRIAEQLDGRIDLDALCKYYVQEG